MRLKRRAARHGRSTEAEHREIIGRRGGRSFEELAVELRELTKRGKQILSEILQREGREERNRLVIEAAVKCVIEEVGTQRALALRQRAKLIAPELLIAECENILGKKVRSDELTPVRGPSRRQAASGRGSRNAAARVVGIDNPHRHRV